MAVTGATSTAARASPVAPARRAGVRDDRAPQARTAARALGAVALAACVAGALRIAVGAADGRYLLELPNGANPHWVDGPLRGLSSIAGGLGPDGLSLGVLLMCAGYAGALACARSISLRTALAAVAVANLAFTLGPTIVSTDVFGYIAYAREVALHGLNPYVSTPLALRGDPILGLVYWKHQPSPYGPLFTALSAPLGFLSPSAALWLLKAGAGASSLAIAALLAGAARRRGLDPVRAAVFFGLNPVLLLYAVSGAHNDLIAMLLVVCAMVLMLRERSRGAGAAVVAGAAVKLTVGLALPFILLGSRRRAQALRGAALALVVIGVPAVAFFGLSFFDQLHRISTDPLFDTTFSGPDRLATALGTHITSPIRLASTAAAAAVALAAIVWVRRGGDAITAAGWAFLGLVASIASLAPWYLVWVLPCAALGRSRALRAAALLASVYLIGVHLPAFGQVPWLSQAGPPTPSLHASVPQPGARGAGGLPRPGAGDVAGLSWRANPTEGRGWQI